MPPLGLPAQLVWHPGLCWGPGPRAPRLLPVPRPSFEPGQGMTAPLTSASLYIAVIRAKVVGEKEVGSGNDIYGNPIKRIEYEIKQIKVRGQAAGGRGVRLGPQRSDTVRKCAPTPVLGCCWIPGQSPAILGADSKGIRYRLIKRPFVCTCLTGCGGVVWPHQLG